jgi:hypothetical protein
MTDLNASEMLEVEADRRRRVGSALRLGTEAPEAGARPPGAGALLAGVAIAIAVALVLAVVAIAQGAGALGGAGHSPAPAASPSHSP